MSKQIAVLLMLLIVVATPATSHGPLLDAPTAGCVNGYVRYSRTAAAAFVTMSTINTLYHVPGISTDHSTTATSATVDDCFEWTDTNGSHWRYVCDDAFFKIRTSTLGSIGRADRRVVVSIASKTQSTAFTILGEIESPSRVFGSNNSINGSFVQFMLDFDVQLEKDRYYALTAYTETIGLATSFTIKEASWIEFQERRCQLGTP